MSLSGKTSTSFYVPAPSFSHTIFSCNPAVFKSHFLLSSHGVGVFQGKLALGFILDSGYGAPIDQDALLKFNSSLRRDLQRYQKARWKYLKTLLTLDPTTDEVRTRPLVHHVETTEIGDAAFVVGCLGSRYITAEWLAQRGDKLNRFWHFSVYCHPAVSVSLYDTKSRPDYLVQGQTVGTAPGLWYAVEAKGSLGKENWEPLRTGLWQATQLAAIEYNEHGGKKECEIISDHAVSLACFDADRLHVVHVDPPIEKGNSTPETIPADLQFDADMLALLVAYQGYQQFRILTTPIKRSIADAHIRGRYYAGKLILDAGRGRSAQLAIPAFVHENAALFSDVLCALATVTPALAGYFRNRQHIDIEDWRAWVHAQREMRPQSGTRRSRMESISRRMWGALLAPGSDEVTMEVPAGALAAMRRIAKATVIPGQRARQNGYDSIESMRENVELGIKCLHTDHAHLELGEELASTNESRAVRLQSSVTLQGLLLLITSTDVSWYARVG